MNNNYLLSMEKGKYLTMINQRGQSRIMCFQNVKDAQRCKDYVQHFKRTYGSWPILDLSITNHKIDFNTEKLNKSKDCNVSIKEINPYTLKYYCNTKMNNFLMCQSFTTHYENNRHTIDFTGEEMLCDEIDHFASASNLNKIYDNY